MARAGDRLTLSSSRRTSEELPHDPAPPRAPSAQVQGEPAGGAGRAQGQVAGQRGHGCHCRGRKQPRHPHPDAHAHAHTSSPPTSRVRVRTRRTGRAPLRPPRRRAGPERTPARRNASAVPWSGAGRGDHRRGTKPVVRRPPLSSPQTHSRRQARTSVATRTQGPARAFEVRRARARRCPGWAVHSRPASSAAPTTAARAESRCPAGSTRLPLAAAHLVQQAAVHRREVGQGAEHRERTPVMASTAATMRDCTWPAGEISVRK